MSVAEQFGANLRYCRRRAGLSQEETAMRASLHRTAVSYIERGTRIPRIDTRRSSQRSSASIRATCSTGSSGNQGTFVAASSSPTRTLRSEHGQAVQEAR